jgi:hypothetical protein
MTSMITVLLLLLLLLSTCFVGEPTAPLLGVGPICHPKLVPC